MGSVIHGASHKALKFLREHPATLAVYWVYLARTNYENVAWPSIRGLAQETGWSAPECLHARAFLVEHQALELVEGYVRPDWRGIDESERKKMLNFDKAEYYRPTGRIVFDNVIYPMLYQGKQEVSDIENHIEETAAPDVQQEYTPMLNTVVHRCTTVLDVQQGCTELNTSDSKLNTTTKRGGKKRKGGNDTGEPKPRKPIQRSDLFKKLAAESFGIFDVDTLGKSTIVRVNKLEKWLKDNSPGATVDTLTAFYEWYDNKFKKQISRPRDPSKFEEHFLAFKQQRLATKNRPPVQMSDYSKWRLEEMGEAVPDAS